MPRHLSGKRGWLNQTQPLDEPYDAFAALVLGTFHPRGLIRLQQTAVEENFLKPCHNSNFQSLFLTKNATVCAASQTSKSATIDQFPALYGRRT
jgi:hypothetical protein